MGIVFLSQIWCFSQSYPMRSFVRNSRNAQGTEKIQVFLRENGPDPLRRAQPVSVVLQIARAAPLSPVGGALAVVRSSRGYHPADMFLAHVFSIVAGNGRVEDTQSLLHNGLIPPLLGLNEFPHRRYAAHVSVALWFAGAAQPGSRPR
jgi:hypothetical protein